MTSQPGIGVLLSMLGGQKEDAEAVQTALGRTIRTVALSDDSLRFVFDDGTHLRLWDDGQSCCESRYMTCEDDLTYFCGAKLLSLSIRAAPNVPHEYGEHEMQFLHVTTSKGVFVCATHNEHNGYYGGFWLRASAEGAG